MIYERKHSLIMEKRELKKYLILGAIIIGICVIVKNLSVIWYIINIVLNALNPLILGAAIAYVFNIFLSFCERHYFPKKKTGFIAKTRRGVCLVFSLVFIVLVAILLFKVVVPEFIKSIGLICAQIPVIAKDVTDWAIEKSDNFPDIQNKLMELDVDWGGFAKTAFKFITVGAGGIIGYVADVMSAFTLTLTRVVIAIIFAIYLLICKDGIKQGLKRAEKVYIKPTVSRKLNHILGVANKTFKAFFVGQFTEAIVLGMLCAGGMFLLKLPYAAMTGTVVGVTALIPIVGAYIGAALGAFMILTENPSQALVFLIFLVILQQLEGNLIYPKVVGSSIGLPGIWVLAAVTVGGSLFGITGMLIGVPLTATIYKLVYEDIGKRERVLVRKNHKTSSEQTNKPEKANKQDENVKNKNTKK